MILVNGLFDKNLFVENFIKSQKRWDGYALTVELKEDLSTHYKGEYPKKILDFRRPSESEEIKEYRKKSYVPKTMKFFSKVINSLSKVRRSPEFIVNYNEQAEKLNDVLKSNYHDFLDFYDFVFNYWMGISMYDANAIIYVKPEFISETEGYKHYPVLFESQDILYKSPEYLVLKNGEGFLILTKDEIVEIKKGKQDYTYQITENKFNTILACNIGGIYECTKGGVHIFKSRLYNAVADLNEAVRIQSDLDAEIVQHVHSQRWFFSANVCTSCSGSGRKRGKADQICPKCNGEGAVISNPYENNLVVSSKAMPGEELKLPIPPAGYIQKTDVDTMVRILKELFEKSINDAYSTINMEFINKTPLNESGISKSYDRDELNNFVYSYCQNAVKFALDYISKIACITYDKKESEVLAIMPKISIPTTFDLVTSDYYFNELKVSKDSKTSFSTQKNLEIDYIEKRYKRDSIKGNLLRLEIEMNPLYGYTEDEKMAAYSNKSITLRDYVMSNNMSRIIRSAYELKSDYIFTLNTTELKKILTPFVDEIIMENNPTSIDTSNELATTVGGLNAMLSINQAVKNGEYDYDAAVALVANRFGITEEEARRQISKP